MAGSTSSCAAEPLGRTPARPLRSAFRFVLRASVALLAPGSCQLCGDRLLQPVDYPVCQHCLHRLQSSPLRGTCKLCGEPLAPESMTAAYAAAGHGQCCSACEAATPPFVRATAFGLYDDLRPAIRLMKFEGVPSLAKPLGGLLAEAILQLQDQAPASMVVVPVPLFRGKRPYNQSTLLAESALRCVSRAAPGWSLSLRTSLLKRKRPTESQFLLSPAQRGENLRGAFQPHGDVRGRHVLLIDDVYTTGATARECARTLRAAGASSVFVATLARAGRDVAVRWRTDPGARAGSAMAFEAGQQARRIAQQESISNSERTFERLTTL